MRAACLLLLAVLASAPWPRPAAAAQPVQVRVLLQRTRGSLTLPQPGRRYQVGGRSLQLVGPLTVSTSGRRQWQVGAWQDRATATGVAARLASALGPAVQVHELPTAGGLIRVRVEWPAGPPADAAAQLERLGFAGATPVQGGGSLLLRDGDGRTVELAGVVTLEPLGSWPTAVESQLLRGSLQLRVSGNDLLLINLLDLESYLRGVVPVEMGPAVFPELEALKAQAVAARTYAVAHLGDHDDEGYDLCATAACQAYGGTTAEHALTDRAIRDTAGLIAVSEGRAIDAMYTSTCGGHTEQAALIFPDRAQPYLQGVVCAWERALVLHGALADSGWYPRDQLREELARSVLGLSGQPSPAAVLAAVAQRCGATAGQVELAAPAQLADGLLRAAGLDQADALVPGPSGLDRLLQLTDLLDIDLSPATAAWHEGWHLRAALAVLQARGEVARETGELVPRPEGVGIYPLQAERSQLLPSPLPLYEAWRDAVHQARQVEARPGTLAERWRAGSQVLALVVLHSGGDGEADRRSAWRGWVRELTWADLERRLGLSGLEELRVRRRSPTGRVIGLELRTGAGTRQLHGYEVKRSLGLPESLFTMVQLGRGDDALVRFIGRGWGHGIGLCQNGAYGLARSGRSFAEILRHYYTGISIEAIAAVPATR